MKFNRIKIALFIPLLIGLFFLTTIDKNGNVKLLTAVTLQAQPADTLQPAAADTTTATTVTNSETDITKSFTTLGGLAALLLAVMTFVKKKLNPNKEWSIGLSVIVAFVLSGVGWFLKLGMYAALPWYYIIIYGALAVVFAYGFVDKSLVLSIASMLKTKLPKE